MTDDIQERLNFREVDEHGKAVTATPDYGTPAPGDGKRRVNPFILALWILDAAILLPGIWALALTMDTAMMYGSGPMPVPFLMLNVMPFCFLASALTTAGLLFWHAAQWQNRHGG